MLRRRAGAEEDLDEDTSDDISSRGTCGLGGVAVPRRVHGGCVDAGYRPGSAMARVPAGAVGGWRQERCHGASRLESFGSRLRRTFHFPALDVSKGRGGHAPVGGGPFGGDPSDASILASGAEIHRRGRRGRRRRGGKKGEPPPATVCCELGPRWLNPCHPRVHPRSSFGSHSVNQPAGKAPASPLAPAAPHANGPVLMLYADGSGGFLATALASFPTLLGRALVQASACSVDFSKFESADATNTSVEVSEMTTTSNGSGGRKRARAAKGGKGAEEERREPS